MTVQEQACSMFCANVELFFVVSALYEHCALHSALDQSSK